MLSNFDGVFRIDCITNSFQMLSKDGQNRKQFRATIFLIQRDNFLDDSGISINDATTQTHAEVIAEQMMESFQKSQNTGVHCSLR